MFVLGDIVGGIITGINTIVETHKINDWIKLILTLIFTFWLTGSFACGTSLAVFHRSWPEAIGTGLISASSLTTVAWRRSPLTRGLMLVLPAAEAKTEIETDVQVISK